MTYLIIAGLIIAIITIFFIGDIVKNKIISRIIQIIITMIIIIGITINIDDISIIFKDIM